jgi:hypothetical protein
MSGIFQDNSAKKANFQARFSLGSPQLSPAVKQKHKDET